MRMSPQGIVLYSSQLIGLISILLHYYHPLLKPPFPAYLNSLLSALPVLLSLILSSISCFGGLIFQPGIEYHKHKQNPSNRLRFQELYGRVIRAECKDWLSFDQERSQTLVGPVVVRTSAQSFKPELPDVLALFLCSDWFTHSVSWMRPYLINSPRSSIKLILKDVCKLYTHI